MTNNNVFFKELGKLISKQKLAMTILAKRKWDVDIEI